MAIDAIPNHGLTAPLPLDPMPRLDAVGWRSSSAHGGVKTFTPRPGYSQNREDYES